MVEERDRSFEEPYQHRISIENREETFITGVIHVASFDDQEIVIETEMGMLMVRGEDLHIRQLSLENGQFTVEGLIHGIQYVEDRVRPGGRGKTKTLIDRLLR
jgi:sporulation protein YabP